MRKKFKEMHTRRSQFFVEMVSYLNTASSSAELADNVESARLRKVGWKTQTGWTSKTSPNHSASEYFHMASRRSSHCPSTAVAPSDEHNCRLGPWRWFFFEAPIQRFATHTLVKRPQSKDHIDLPISAEQVAGNFHTDERLIDRPTHNCGFEAA